MSYDEILYESADHVATVTLNRIIKQQVYEALFQTLEQAIDSANEEMLKSFTCQDFQEGVAHFLEKRAPAFTGK